MEEIREESPEVTLARFCSEKKAITVDHVRNTIRGQYPDIIMKIMTFLNAEVHQRALDWKKREIDQSNPKFSIAFGGDECPHYDTLIHNTIIQMFKDGGWENVGIETVYKDKSVPLVDLSISHRILHLTAHK